MKGRDSDVLAQTSKGDRAIKKYSTVPVLYSIMYSFK
jgi:hypothetical protein